MRVILNVSPLHGPMTGIGYYTRNLTEALLRSAELESLEGLFFDHILPQEELGHLIDAPLYGNISSKGALDSLKSRLIAWARSVPAAYELRQTMRRFRCRKSLASKAGFIFHETNYIPCAQTLPTIITVHDLSHIRYPDFHPPERVAYLSRHLPHAMREASRIIVVSESVRHEVIETFNIPENRVAAIPHGVSTEFHPREESACSSTLRSLGLRYRQFFLSVGTLEPRKNIERLLQAYESLPSRIRESHPLVLVGGKGWKDKAIWDRIKRSSDPHNIILTGYISQSDLVNLYSSATCFVYPSLYEGFGLPILEAMASGVPVITSNVSSMPEVAGAAALLADPTSTEAIAHAMQSIVEDQTLACDLAQRGLERAKAFTWERCASQTLSVYRQVAS